MKNEILAARARCWSEVENSGSNGPESEFDTLCATGWTGLKKLWDMPLDVVLVLEGTSWPERAGKFSKVLSTLLEVFEKLVHQGFQSRAKSGKQSEVISGTTVISPSRGLSEKLSYRRTNCSSDQKGRRPHKHRPVDIDGRTVRPARFAGRPNCRPPGSWRFRLLGEICLSWTVRQHSGRVCKTCRRASGEVPQRVVRRSARTAQSPPERVHATQKCWEGCPNLARISSCRQQLFQTRSESFPTISESFFKLEMCKNAENHTIGKINPNP